MKSAKETLAQYRLQGFSDELIELLAMEEKDQEFAEALLDALISEQEVNKNSQVKSTQEHNETDFENEGKNNSEHDKEESEELIKSAYIRNGITESEEIISDNFNSENNDNTYIPPQLEVLEGGEGNFDPSIIPFNPEYALSEEEHEYAVARSLMFFGEIEHADEITPHYSELEEIISDSSLYVEDVEVAEISDYEITEEYDEVEVIDITEQIPDTNDEFDCFDFDAIGRSTEKENKIIDFNQAILDLENSRPAEKEWTNTKSKAVIELEKMKNWAEGVENNIINTMEEKNLLENELNARDDTIIVQGREMEQLKDINASYLMQLSDESTKLANTQSKLQNLRDEHLRSENMLLKFGNEIELLHDQLSTVNSICKNQSSELLKKESVINELNIGYSKLLKRNESEISIAKGKESLQDKEISRTNNIIKRLNNEISDFKSQIELLNSSRSYQSSEYLAQTKTISSLTKELSNISNEKESLENKNDELEKLSAKQARRIRRLEKIREKIKTLEFENNVYKTETIPNLQADKEDLVELASEEYNKNKTLDELAAKRARRLSYSTTLAAAACLMLVLMPILSWNNVETEKTNIKSEYSMQLASAEANNLKLEQNLASMQEKLELLNNEYNTAKESWSVQLSNLKMEMENSVHDHQIIQTASGNNLNESEFNVLAYDEDLTTEPISTQAGFESEAQYNNVSGLDEYKQEFAQNTSSDSNLELLEGKQTKVRRGEGLSQVLWRVYRRSNPQMVSYISNLNNLKKDRRGNPLLKVDQKLLLPKDVNTAMATNSDTKQRM